MAIAPLYVDIAMNDGATHRVRILLVDKLQFEKTARLRNWKMEEAPFLSTAFWAWHAATREGLIECTFDEFTDGGRCLDVAAVGDADTDEVDPTRQTGPARR